MKIADLLIGGAATWRITHLLLYENGPFRLLRRARVLFGVVYAEDDSNDLVSFKYEITTCPWCLSVWVAMVVTLLLRLFSGARWLLLPFTFSMMSVTVSRFFERTKRDGTDFPEFTIK